MRLLGGNSFEQPDEQMNDLVHDISRHVWQTKYRYCGREGEEHAIDDTWRRIARALAAVEGPNAGTWEQRFLTILRDFRFLPGGRIQPVRVPSAT